MSDLNSRFNKIEASLERVAADQRDLRVLLERSVSGSPSMFSEGLDLLALIKFLLKNWLIVLASVALFSILSVSYALHLPDIYRSTIVLTPAQGDSRGAGVASQYGGLAALAGIDLSKEDSRIVKAVEYLQSWAFLESFIEKYDITPEVVAAVDWDRVAGKVIYDSDVYDEERGGWLKGEPSLWEAHNAFRKRLEVSYDEKKQLLSISVEHVSPQLAFDWSLFIKKELNVFYQNKDVQEANRNIAYLNKKISETNIAQMQSVFYGMIESQMKTKMLAEVSEEYLVQTVIPPKLSEQKVSPRRAFICVFGAFLGGVFGILLVFVRFLLLLKI